MFITLKEAKKHLNLDEEYFAEDDEYILSLIGVAEDAVSKRIDRRLSECIDPDTGELEASIRQAILLLIGTFYSQREATTPQSVKTVPLAFDFLADLNRHYSIR